MMTLRTVPVVRSARIYLWPAIALNVVAVSLYLGVDLTAAALMALAIPLLASFSFILNDLWDLEVDAHNCERRLNGATVAGRRLAAGAACALLLLALALLVAGLGDRGGWLFLAVVIGSVGYTALVRSVVILAACTAAAVSLAPVWGPALVGNGVDGFFLVVLVAAWLMLVGREILLDVKDVHGDRVGRRVTFPLIAGVSRAVGLARSLVVVGGVLLVCGALALKSHSVVTIATSVALLAIVPMFSDIALRSRLERAVRWSRLAMVGLALVWLGAA